MVIWLAMLIPIVGCAVAYHLWGKKFVWWEMVIPMVASFIVIFLIKAGVEKAMLSDTQYRGGIIVEAKYYEYWSTWVTKTCSEQYACGSHTEGSGSSAHSVTDYCTRYYDCSYCDENSPYWEVSDNQGHTYRVSEATYNRLKAQWSATPEFVNMHRDIDKHWSCGVDGNAYSIKWDNGMLDVETSTWETSYDNYVQVSKSNFGIMDVSKDEVKKYHLYEYPVLDGYYQQAILGLDSLNYLAPNLKRGANKMFEYFDGYYGPIRKIRVFVLLFSGQSMDVAVKQKYYWVNGNKNEVVICIDVDKNTGEINWVYPFTWSENKRIEVDLREDISNLKTLDFTKLYHVVDESTKDFKYRDFSKFDYLSVDTPTWEVWLVYLLTLGITIGFLYYGYSNEYESED